MNPEFGPRHDAERNFSEVDGEIVPPVSEPRPRKRSDSEMAAEHEQVRPAPQASRTSVEMERGKLGIDEARAELDALNPPDLPL